MKQKKSHISEELFSRYISGQLSKDEAYEVEQLLQSSELYNDAIDGFEEIESGNLEEEFLSLKNKIPFPNQEKKRPAFFYYKIAAVIALFLLATVAMWQLTSETGNQRELSNRIQKDSISNQQQEINPEENIAENELPQDTLTETKEVYNESGNDSGLAANRPNIGGVTSKDSQLDTLGGSLSGIAQAPIAYIEIAAEEEIMEEIVMEDIKADDFDDVTLEEAGEQGQRGTVPLRQEKLESAKSSVPDSAKKELASVRGRYDRDKNRKKISELNDQVLSENEKGYFRSVTEKKPNLSSPYPEGGEAVLKKYLSKNGIKLKGNKKRTQTTLRFKVDSSGQLQELKIIEGDTLFSKKVISVLSEGPKWIPSSDTVQNIITRQFYKKD